VIFFYNIIRTIYGKAEEPEQVEKPAAPLNAEVTS
jgi:hypothetical protein